MLPDQIGLPPSLRRNRCHQSTSGKRRGSRAATMGRGHGEHPCNATSAARRGYGERRSNELSCREHLLAAPERRPRGSCRPRQRLLSGGCIEGRLRPARRDPDGRRPLAAATRIPGMKSWAARIPGYRASIKRGRRRLP